MRPIIGITCSSTDLSNSISTSYVSAIENAGGTSILLPSIRNDSCITDYIRLIDGLLLAGGVDVDPLYFGEEPRPLMGKIDVDRDYLEIHLIPEALKMDLPVLGICRGIQVLNVAMGGKIYQDISMSAKSILKHRQDAPGSYATHTIDVQSESQLLRILGSSTIRTNSFHHQAVREAAPGFIISAVAQDGIIEGIESINHTFVVGVQFHPEQMWYNNPPITNLFVEYVSAAKEYRQRQKRG
jgi:putative glutamine amidotransferase